FPHIEPTSPVMRVSRNANYTHGANPTSRDVAIDNGGVIFDTRITRHLAAEDFCEGPDKYARRCGWRCTAATIGVQLCSGWAGITNTIAEAFRPSALKLYHIGVTIN